MAVCSGDLPSPLMAIFLPHFYGTANNFPIFLSCKFHKQPNRFLIDQQGHDSHVIVMQDSGMC